MFQICEGLFKRAFYLLHLLLIVEHGTEVPSATGGPSSYKANATVRKAELELIER